MDLSYLGAGSVKLGTKTATVVVDPYDESFGLGSFGAKGDVFLQTEPRQLKLPGIVFDSPGEYEVQGVMISGVPARLHVDETGEKGTIFSIVNEGINVVITGNITPGLSDSQLEEIGKVDVLVVPVGGYGLTLDATAAAELVSRLEPAYVIPVHYDDGKTKYPMPQDKVEKFFKELGANPEPVTKLKLSSRDLPAETTPVYLVKG